MKKTKAYALCLILLFSFLLSCPKVFAQTDINGDIISTDTTWTKADSPYVIYQTPTIEAGATLTIEAGTIIKSDLLEGIDVYGNLVTNGTANDLVYFTSLYDDSIGGDTDGDGGLIIPNPGDWEGINFFDGGNIDIKSSEIDYAYAGIDSEYGSGLFDSISISHSVLAVYLYESTLNINSLNINDVSFNALSFYSSSTADVNNSVIMNVKHYGVEIDNSTSTFNNLIIDGDLSEAMDISNNSYVSITDSVIKNSFSGIEVYDNSKLDFENSIMENITGNRSAFATYNNSKINISSSTVNEISGNYAFDIFNNSNMTISESLLENFHGQYAIDVFGDDNGYATSTLEITNSKINNGDKYGLFVYHRADAILNNVEISGFLWDGIYTYANPQITITNSNISGNDYGIESYGANINISNSTIKDNYSFGIYNGGQVITAINNWWGSDTGPFNATKNASGTANRVSNYVDFIPWLASDPKIKKNIPIIIIPGVMGTQLLKNYGDSSEIWPNITGLITSFSDAFLNDLSLLPDGSEDPNFPITVGDIMRKVELAGSTVLNTWQGMIDTLTAGGYVEGTDLFVFPYDWRKSNAEDAELLKIKIDEIIAQTGSAKVDILAHSMGGLVAQKYVADNGGNYIDKLFFIGTPHLGAPKAFKAVMFGDDMGIKKLGVSLLSPDEVKNMSQNMPAVFDLLPSQNYVDTQNKYIYDAISTTSKWLNYDETKSLMINLGANSQMFQQAEDLHTDIDSFNLPGPEVYNFSGCGLTKTISGITLKKKKSWTSLWQKEVDDYSLDYTNGDETVPLISAVGPFGNNNYYVKGTAHSELPSASNLPETVLAILLDTNTSISTNISTSSAFCDVSGRIVSTHSPVTLDIYDGAGNHTGATSTGDIEYGISGVTYDIINGDTFSFLPDNNFYRIIVKAIDTGAYDFYVTDIGNNDIKIGKSYWNEIPLTSLSSNFEINIFSTSTNYVIRVDQDGDGTFESNILPSAILSSTTAPDLIPPQTTNSVSSTGTVSFFATDDDSGILKTEYTFDGNTWFVYSVPFNASGKSINYFSIDKAGNSELMKNVTVPVLNVAPAVIVRRVSHIYPIDQNSTSTAVGQNESQENHTELIMDIGGSDTEQVIINQLVLSPSINTEIANKVYQEIIEENIIGQTKPDKQIFLDEFSSSSLVATVADQETKINPTIMVISAFILVGLVFINKKYMIKL